MSVTKKDIASRFNVTLAQVSQVDSKQLFIVNSENGTVLVSYYTIVGKLVAGTWYLTTEKYSVITTKQLSQFARGRDVIFTANLSNLESKV